MRLSLKDAILYGIFNVYFRHILACSRFTQPYLFLLRHIRTLVHIKEHCASEIIRYTLNATHNLGIFRVYSAIFTTVGIFAHIRIYFGRFRYIPNPATVRRIDVY